MKKLIFILLLLNYFSLSIAQEEVSKVGTSGAQFLKLGVGARACALGETMVATRGDVSSLYWNPAGIATISTNSLTVSRNELYVGLAYNFAGFVLPINKSSAAGFSVLYLDSGEMEVTTVDEPEGTGSFFNWRSFSIGCSYGRFLTNRLSLGATVKYIYEGAYSERANTLAFDVGALLNTGVLGFRLGLCMSNIGDEMRFSSPDAPHPAGQFYGNEEIIAQKAKLETQAFPLPQTFRLGLSTDIIGSSSKIIQHETNRITVNVDVNDPNDAFLRSNLGIEYEWNSLLFLRGGYRGLTIERDPMNDYNTSSYTFGLGLKYKFYNIQLKFDYAFADYKSLGSANHFTLGIDF